MMKIKLNSVKWNSFKIKDIFSISRGKRQIGNNRIKGNIPYYSASSFNNGITDFVSNPTFVLSTKLLVSTFCDCFYSNSKFTASDEMSILSNENLNKYNAQFISVMIKANSSKYAFGRKAFTERVKKQIIKLPVDSNNPNWEFMESYIKQEESKQISQIVDYYTNHLIELFKDSSSKMMGGGIYSI